MRRRVGVEVLDLGPSTSLGSNTITFGSAKVHIKRDLESTNAFMVVAELVCTRLAMALGVPVPMGDVGFPEIKKTFVSAQISLDGQQLPPADATAAVAAHQQEAALIAAFDVLIWNEDRHEDNLLYHPDVGLWAIDHELALAGEDMFDAAVLKAHRDSPTRHHSLVSVACDAVLMKAATDRILGLSKSAIDGALGEAQSRGLLTVAEAKALADFITHRRDNIRLLAKSSAEKSSGKKGVTAWTTDSLPGTSSSTQLT